MIQRILIYYNSIIHNIKINEFIKRTNTSVKLNDRLMMENNNILNFDENENKYKKNANVHY